MKAAHLIDGQSRASDGSAEHVGGGAYVHVASLSGVLYTQLHVCSSLDWATRAIIAGDVWERNAMSDE